LKRKEEAQQEGEAKHGGTMSEITLDTERMEWEKASSYPDGTRIKVLRDEGDKRSVLLELPGGFRMEAHTHTCCEQHFVLEGSYEAAGEEHGVGTYQCIPAHTNHGPFSSRRGAMILVVWEG
jgi:anti-sigma factor ChrR (cupin superfamily)